MTSLAILYIGQSSGTSSHRAHALRRLGHRVFTVDPYRVIPYESLVQPWMDKTGALFLADLIRVSVLKAIGSNTFDLVWVDSGNLVSPSLVRELKHRFGTVINYNVDDPYGDRDGDKWRLYLRSVPFYDLIAVVRECNVLEALKRDAKDVIFVHRSADEVAHSPRQLTEPERQKWESEVTFIGTWMPERGPFLARLTQLGVPLTIYGNRWQRASEWGVLQKYWRGASLDTDEEYALAVQAAAVCLGLVSKENRDLSTQRSFEIPHLRGVLCAESTSEHLSLYTGGEEALFWSDAEECAVQCARLLRDEDLRARIRKAGRLRCLRNGTTNELVMNRVLARAVVECRAESILQK